MDQSSDFYLSGQSDELDRFGNEAQEWIEEAHQILVQAKKKVILKTHNDKVETEWYLVHQRGCFTLL